jgi:hypothetical protein
MLTWLPWLRSCGRLVSLLPRCVAGLPLLRDQAHAQAL